MSTTSRTVIDVRPGQVVRLGPDVHVELIHKTGRCARLLVVASRDISIDKVDGAPTSAAQPAQEGVPSIA